MFKEFNNLKEFDAFFPDEKSCIDHFRMLRWPQGVVCPHCGGVERIYDLKLGKHKCGDCKGKFTVRHGSIFEDSKLPLRTWFRAIFFMTSMKKGVASHRLAELLGVTQKTAWFVLHRIREATMTEEFKRPVLMSGTVQMDETLVGGKEGFKHANKRTPDSTGRGSIKSKITVFGMLGANGELRMRSIPSAQVGYIRAIVEKNVRRGTKIHTDEATHYKWMNANFEHSLVKHRFGQYVSEYGIHTNGIEGAFSHFKRSITGVYHKASDEHIDRYLGMFSWRWTRRKINGGARVNALLQATPGRRLTYKVLTRKIGSK